MLSMKFSALLTRLINPHDSNTAVNNHIKIDLPEMDLFSVNCRWQSSQTESEKLGQLPWLSRDH